MKMMSNEVWNKLVADNDLRLIKRQIDGINMIWEEFMACLNLTDEDQLAIAAMLAINLKDSKDVVTNRTRLREYVKLLLSVDDPLIVH